MHTHHSHSGQFCQHAKNSLEEMLLRAIELKFTVFCMSEHIPRLQDKHLYPEEVASSTSVSDLSWTFDEYINEARRLQKKYADQIEVLVGFECEAINHDYLKQVEFTLQTHKPDYFVGSLHHSGDTPIDFDKKTWEIALRENGGEDALVRHYFVQLNCLIALLKPPVIGHFDLVRLFSPDYQLKGSSFWPQIVRTIKTAVRLGCLFEINSSALRKGWSTPYPQRDIAEKIVELGGKLCLSDDSHSVEQVGLNYHKALAYLESLGVEEVWRLQRSSSGVITVSVPLCDFLKWNKLVNV